MAQTVYDYLATTQVDDATITQLEQALRNSFIRQESRTLWSSALQLAAAMRDSRTYPHGLPIPEGGAVVATEGTNATVQPSGSGLYAVEAISVLNESGGAADVTLSMYDGSDGAVLHTEQIADGNTAVISLSKPLHLSNSLYLLMGSTQTVTISVAYHAVSL